jgi:RHS repeat-associated protein
VREKTEVNYSTFGAPQTGRAGGSYRYGFNGKENDNEIKGVEGSSQDYGLRMYDPRVGRFFSADPLMFGYPHYTPYQFAGNKPITYIDLDGAEEYHSGSGTGTETNPNGGSANIPADATGYYTYTESTGTVKGTSTQSHHPVGSVAGYERNGAIYCAYYNVETGEFTEYGLQPGSSPHLDPIVSKSAQANAVVMPVLIANGYMVPQESTEMIPVNSGHLPSQEELGCNWGYSELGFNSKFHRAMTGLGNMEEALYWTMGGCVVGGMVMGAALVTAPVWVPAAGQMMLYGTQGDLLTRATSAGVDLTGQMVSGYMVSGSWGDAWHSVNVTQTLTSFVAPGSGMTTLGGSMYVGARNAAFSSAFRINTSGDFVGAGSSPQFGADIAVGAWSNGIGFLAGNSINSLYNGMIKPSTYYGRNIMSPQGAIMMRVLAAPVGAGGKMGAPQIISGEVGDEMKR